MPGRRAPAVERFLRLRARDPVTGCWEWLGARDPNGYGRFFDGIRLVHAHRAAWQLLCDESPVGLDLHHLCRNAGWVNPTHLWPLTRREHARIHQKGKRR